MKGWDRRVLTAALGGAAVGAGAALAFRRSQAFSSTAARRPASEEALAGIERLSAEVMEKLVSGTPVTVEGMDPSLHYMAPHVAKATWDALGDLVAANEKRPVQAVGGEKWISLRLDGCGFSKAVRALRNKGILEKGFSETFANCMTDSLRALMEHFQARLGFTQSDEMIVFIPPTRVVRGEQQPHIRGGRVTKLTTLAASFVTSQFLMQLAKKCQEAQIDLECLKQVSPHFDCRLGQYDSFEQARSLLMWRAYDCSVNGVSDAVYQIPGSGKTVMGMNKLDKAEWLWKEGHLPLPRHQAYGTVLVKVKRVVEGFNPKLQKAVSSLRGRIEQVDGPVLELMRKDALFPPDEECGEAEEEPEEGEA